MLIIKLFKEIKDGKTTFVKLTMLCSEINTSGPRIFGKYLSLRWNAEMGLVSNNTYIWRGEAFNRSIN